MKGSITLVFRMVGLWGGGWMGWGAACLAQLNMLHRVGPKLTDAAELLHNCYS